MEIVWRQCYQLWCLSTLLWLSAATPSRMARSATRPDTANINLDRFELKGTFTEREGHVCVETYKNEAESSPGCDKSSWLIKLSPNLGVTADIHLFRIPNVLQGYRLYFFNSANPSDAEPIRHITALQSGYAPVLSHTSTLLILWKYPLCIQKLNISYYGHPLASIPREVTQKDKRWTTSTYKYDCSSISSADLPVVIRCDLVQQCIGGEDEEGCTYRMLHPYSSPHEPSDKTVHIQPRRNVQTISSLQRQNACGDWIPYGEHCIQAFLSTNRSFISTLQADVCVENHGGTLAVLPHYGGDQFVANIFRGNTFHAAVVGLGNWRPEGKKIDDLYRHLWQWMGSGGLIAHWQIRIQIVEGGARGVITRDDTGRARLCPVISFENKRPLTDGYVCMKSQNTSNTNKTEEGHVVTAHLSGGSTNWSAKFDTNSCSDGSRVQTFHTCQWSYLDDSSIVHNVKPATALSMFRCRYGSSVHYTLVCDGVADCMDGSDEQNCKRPKSNKHTKTVFMCRLVLQWIPVEFRCDGKSDCFDESDEEECDICRYGQKFNGRCINKKYHFENDSFCGGVLRSINSTVRPPVVVTLDGFGFSELENVASCTDRFFSCDSDLCLQSYMINNGEKDCPHGQDERISVEKNGAISMEKLTCPGHYRCQYYGICVHTDFVCDGVYHCPNKDDERYCHLNCPENCSCEGHAFTCRQMIELSEHVMLRYLDVSRIPIPDLHNLSAMPLLLFLNLSACGLKNVTFMAMPQLEILDLSVNALSSFRLVGLRRLTHLYLSRNGLTRVHLSQLVQLQVLDLSFNKLGPEVPLNVDGLYDLRRLILSGNPLLQIPNAFFSDCVLQKVCLVALRVLEMADCNITSIQGRALQYLSSLRKLDIRGNRLVTFDKEMFFGLKRLWALYTDYHKLCCPTFLIKISEQFCYAPIDELSSCSDLLRVNFFRVFLWAFSLLAIAGNTGVMVYWLRAFLKGQTVSRSFGVLVTSLCASDLLMGVYMMIIGAADAYYRGDYLSREEEWRRSVVCKTAGFLAFLSSEVSAFMICLLTTDRLLKLSFPMKAAIHFTGYGALVACGMAWLTGSLLASLPLVFQWQFYGQTGICVPLPIIRRQFPGQKYTFGVFIVLNFALFLFIGLGQLCIFLAIRRASRRVRSSRTQQETSISRRLLMIIMTDFLCWFPVGLMGMLATHGIPIPGVVNLWAAVFLLPLNSALNPFLYTLMTLFSRWKNQHDESVVSRVLGSLQTEIAKWPENSINELQRICVSRQQRMSRKAKEKGGTEQSDDDRFQFSDITVHGPQLDSADVHCDGLVEQLKRQIHHLSRKDTDDLLAVIIHSKNVSKRRALGLIEELPDTSHSFETH